MSSSVNNSTKFIIVLVEDNIHEISPIISLLVSKYSRMYQVKFAAVFLISPKYGFAVIIKTKNKTIYPLNEGRNSLKRGQH